MDGTDTLARFEHQHVTFSEGMALDCGARLASVTVAYRTYGTLNAARTNAVLVCHALTGDQYVAETHPITGKPGWWDAVVGPGLPVDTNRFFVIGANVLGGCMGSTGPASARDDDPSVPWGTDFPPVTIGDMVRAQKKLIDHLGVEKLFAVMGGSMGGMQVLQWAVAYPAAVFAAFRWPPPPITRRRTSPFMRLAARRSSPTRTGRGGATGKPARSPRVVWPSRA